VSSLVRLERPGAGRGGLPGRRAPNSEISFLSVVALATSLPTLYFAKPTFGSFADYAAILTWAISTDQGKNLVQALRAAPPGAAGKAAS